jgi:vancomycin resistance protein YoaR
MEPTKEHRSRGKRTNPSKAIFFCLLVALFFLSAGLASADYFFFKGRIHYGVSISGANIGGMTPVQARRKLYVDSASILDRPIVIIHEGKNWNISPRDLNLNLDIRQAVESAYRLGREGTLVKRISDRLSLWRKPRQVNLQFSLNKGKLKQSVREVKDQAEISPREARIVVKGREVSLSPGREGVQVNEEKLTALLIKGLAKLTGRRIHLATRTIPVHITTEEASLALDEARRMLSRPLTLNFRESKWVLEPEEIGALLSFREERERANGSRFVSRLEPHLNRQRTEEVLKRLTEKIGTPARDAHFEVVGDNVNIVPSEDGFEVDGDSTLALMEEALRGNSLRQASLIMSTTRPQRTTEVAASMRIKEKVSTFTTHFDPRALSRVHNIRVLASALDNTVVAPDEVFSFNKTIGPRTAAKGYQEAPTIINGELVPTLGGGICQVGTTFFNAIFFAGLEIVERHNHSFYISKYPAGRDATVSWGGADLKFRNDTPNYFLIKTVSTQSSLTVTLYGTNPDREVSFTTSPFSNFVPFENKYVSDPGLAKDQQKVEDNGVTGRHITVVRTVKQAGKILHRDKLVSHYKPKKAIVRLGTGEAVPQPPVTAAELASPPATQEGSLANGVPPSEQQAPLESAPQQNGSGEGQN